MISKFINKIQSLNISLTQWLVGFIGILFIRYILENISSQNNLGIITSDFSTLLHYTLFYLGLLISITLCLKIFLPFKISDLTKLSLFILPITWLPPIIDLFITSGEGWNMAYHFQSYPQIFTDFFTFFGDFSSGITLGIRIEIIFLLLGIIILIYKYTKKLSKIILAVLIIYIVIFMWLSAPSLIFIIGDSLSNSVADVYNYISTTANNSIIENNILQPGLEFTDQIRKSEILFNTAMIQIFIILISSLLFIWSYLHNKTSLISIIKNSRPRRNLFYLSFIIIGLFISINAGTADIIWNWLDFTSLLCVIISFYAAWMFSVGINDIIDKPIDKISNTNRPLVVNSVTVDDLKNYNLAFLLLAIISAYSVGTYMLFFVFIFIFAYYIYSSPPLKLKRIPIISTFLISLAALSVTMSSFYLINDSKSISEFPVNIIVLIILTVSLFANIKDIKDYEGDKSNDTTTLPTKYGLEKGKKIISFLTIISFLIFPMILGNLSLLIPSVLGSIISFWLINKKNYQEKYLFYLFFIFIVIILI